jgi:uncharacterized membrane-anchored protein
VISLIDKTPGPLGGIWPAVIAAAGLQLTVLSYMVWSRVDLLRNGREITVDVVPVDPRDLFRGDYVILGYPFSTTTRTTAQAGEPGSVAEADVALPKGSYRNAPVYVTLAQGDGGHWSRVAITPSYPSAIEPGQIVLKGRVDYLWPGTTADQMMGRIRYGIESYFVPEGEGREIEKQVREKKVRAVLAVAADGTAALKALEVDGKRIHEQPVL